MLRQRKLMKHKYKLASEKFNNKPLKADWIRFSMDLGILEPSPAASAHAAAEKESSATKPTHHDLDTAAAAPVKTEPAATVKPTTVNTTVTLEPTTGIDAAALAKFLRRTPGLGKTQIGEYISKGPPDMYPFHALVLKEYVKTFDFSGEF